MLPSFCRSTVMVLRARKVQTRPGAIEHDWADPTVLSITRCAVLPVSTGESSGEARVGVNVTAALYAPPGSDIEIGDRVRTVSGETYQVVGAPQRRESPTGAVSHVRCDLARYVG